MEHKKLKLDFEVTISDIVDLNKSFAKAKCLIAYCGRNRNNSDISKTSFTDALSTIKNIPLVGRYDAEKNKFGSHDIKVIETKDGVDIVNATIPFGVVPESANQWFESLQVNGVEKECLFTDVILWKRQHGYEHIVEAKSIAQSMEIDVSEYTVDSEGYCIIDKFEFNALCLLGNAEPCFENACVQVYSNEIVSDFKLQFSEMLREFKELNQGGKTLDKKNKVLQKYGKTIEDLGFSIDDMSLEDLSAKMEELFGEKTSEPVAFSVTYNQKREALRNALDPIIVKDAAGNYVEETHFYVSDFDDEYVFVEVDHWSADDYSCKYGRYSYTFDDITVTATVADDFEEMVKVWMTIEEKAKLDADRANYEAISTEFESYKNDYSHTNTEFESLEIFKQTVTIEKRKSDIESTFAKFDKKLSGFAEYETLKASEITMDIADLEEKLFAMIGKKTANFTSAQPKETVVTVPVEQFEATEDDGYGGILAKKYSK